MRVLFGVDACLYSSMRIRKIHTHMCIHPALIFMDGLWPVFLMLKLCMRGYIVGLRVVFGLCSTNFGELHTGSESKLEIPLVRRSA